MSRREFAPRPRLEQLKKQAKQLLRERRAQPDSADSRLHNAQLELAREYGFASWPRVRKHVLFQQLVAAVQDDDVKQFRELLDQDRSLVEMPSDDGPTALHWAAWHGRLDMIKLLLRTGADIDRVEQEFGARPAGWANENNQTAARDMLIERGAEVDLSRAAMMGRVDLVRRILAADPDAAVSACPDDWPPLVQAAGWGRLEVMELLLKAGADPNGTGLERVTPLHAAVGWSSDGQAEAVRMLLERGADPYRLDDRGRTVLDLAQGRDQGALAELITAAGGRSARGAG